MSEKQTTMQFVITVTVPAEEAARGEYHIGRQVEKLIEINSDGWTADVEPSATTATR